MDTDFDIDSEAGLAAAVQAALDIENGPEVAAAETAPQAPEIQPQAAPEAEQTTDGVSDSQEARASSVDTPAPVAAEAPKPNPETPKVEERVSPTPSAAPEADAATNQSLQRINAIVQQLEAGMRSEFADLTAPEHVFALMQSNPERYNSFVIAQTKAQQANQALQRAQGEAQQTFIAGEQARLAKAIPELADPEKGDALKAELRAYAKSQGIPDSRQARNADEVIRLHREMALAKEVASLKAEKATQAKAIEEASKKAAQAPQVQKPGVQRDVNTNEKAETDFERFSKTGESEDLARYLQHVI